jgi:hypothetical protein
MLSQKQLVAPRVACSIIKLVFGQETSSTLLLLVLGAKQLLGFWDMRLYSKDLSDSAKETKDSWDISVSFKMTTEFR